MADEGAGDAEDEARQYVEKVAWEGGSAGLGVCEGFACLDDVVYRYVDEEDDRRGDDAEEDEEGEDASQVTGGGGSSCAGEVLQCVRSGRGTEMGGGR